MPGEPQDAPWPLPTFRFTVTLADGVAAPFQQISGLDAEAAPIEYRHGDSPNFSPVKMPGLPRTGNVTAHRGVFARDSALWHWYEAIKLNQIARATVVISLLDERGAPVMIWTLNNAWPTKVTGTDLRSDGNEVAVEALELAFETIAVSRP